MKNYYLCDQRLKNKKVKTNAIRLTGIILSTGAELLVGLGVVVLLLVVAVVVVVLLEVFESRSKPFVST